ncbi:hypothetical protein AAGW05_16055 [Arthrobacter sp. LAPM80]|uniref:hypothetical protein n=1 Tax=Arthrobacter sp. LAPM80 TaxID=3141788 RepID=UPI00398BB71E
MAHPSPDLAEELLSERRVRLDADTIIDAVLVLAREEPQSRFTFKSLGEALGANPTAMCRHFRNCDAILQAARSTGGSSWRLREGLRLRLRRSGAQGLSAASTP